MLLSIGEEFIFLYASLVGGIKKLKKMRSFSDALLVTNFKNIFDNCLDLRIIVSDN